MDLAPFLALIAVICGTRTTFTGRLHCACSENDTARLACFALRSAQDRPSIGADGVKTSGMHPALRLLIDRLPWRKIIGKHSPRCAGADKPTQSVEHHPQIVLTLGRLGRDHGQIGCANGPCVIWDFSGIRSGFSHCNAITRLQTRS